MPPVPVPSPELVDVYLARQLVEHGHHERSVEGAVVVADDLASARGGERPRRCLNTVFAERARPGGLAAGRRPAAARADRAAEAISPRLRGGAAPAEHTAV